MCNVWQPSSLSGESTIWTTLDAPPSSPSKKFLVSPVCHSSCACVPVAVVQLLSHVWRSVTPWTAARQASLSITNSLSLLKLVSIESVIPSNHLILCHPLFLLPSILLSIRVFSSESVLRIRWPKYWSLSFIISPSSEYSGLISFRIDWFDLLAVQGTLKSLLEHHCSKASILWHSAFFYSPTLISVHGYWKIIALNPRPLCLFCCSGCSSFGP